MLKLLNRFAWVMSIILGLQFSFFIDNDGPFDYEGFWTFIIVMFLVKYLFFSEGFIEKRLEYFADALQKRENISNNQVKTVLEKSSQITEEKIIPSKVAMDEVYIIPEDTISQVEDKHEVKKYSESRAEKTRKVEKKVEPSKLVLAIKSFFSENLLAKLGGILVFLGVLFLLGLVYSSIGEVGKLIIGFSIGFTTYFSGVILEKKKLKNEAMILLGIGILINYLVILGGRYLLGDNIGNSYLSEGTTFLFLVFNTVFAVVTSLVYESRNLLLFGFIFAYLNPLLIGSEPTNPYTFIGYGLIVTFGGLYLSKFEKDVYLAMSCFVLSNLLFLIVPFSSELHWIVKLASGALVSIITIFTIYKLDKKYLSALFIVSYVFLIMLLGDGGDYIKGTYSFISYMITILLYFAVGIFFFLRTAFTSLVFLLLSPLLIVLGLCYSGILLSITTVLAIIVLAYLIGFIFVKDSLSDIFKYFFFIILGIYIFFTNSYLIFYSLELNVASFITVMIVSFIFIFTSYYLSTKKNLEFLYSIGTIGGIFVLAPIIVDNYLYKGGDTFPYNFIQFYLSVFSIIIFAVSNWILPFINKNLINSKIQNLVLGLIGGLLFIGFELFNYGNRFFPGTTLGLVFAVLAIIYFILAYILVNQLGIENAKKHENLKNTIYTYIGISLSVFSLAIALIFSNYEAIISATWIFESTILIYFFNKTKETKIFFAAIILLMIGVFDLGNLVNIVNPRDYIFLIPFSIIFIYLVLNVKYLDEFKDDGVRFSHDIFHILGLIILGILLVEIIPSTGHGWSILGISTFLFVLSIVYGYFNSNILKGFFIIVFGGFLLNHISNIDPILYKIDRDGLGYLRSLEYISTFIVGSSLYIWTKLNKSKFGNVFLNIFFAIYIVISTSIYIFDIFDSTFSITMYWGLASSVLLFYGISNDSIKLRTLGLYMITLTSVKIFIFDIALGYGINDGLTRVIAFILVGILFIVLSTIYSKKYGNNILKELNFNNFFIKEKIIDGSKNKINDYINEKIKDMDISDYRGVKFYVNGGDSFEIRSQNLIKIVKMITKDFSDVVFEKNELIDTYEFVVKNYKSELSKSTYDKIVLVLKQFVEKGGRIEALLKNK